MIENIDFERDFSSKWYERIEKPILISTSLSIVIVLTSVIYLANFNFAKYDRQNQSYIFERYKRLVSELIIKEQKTKNDDKTASSTVSTAKGNTNPDTLVSPLERQLKRSEIQAQMAGAGIFKSGQGKDQYADLPLFDNASGEALFNDHITIELSRRSGYSRMHSRAKTPLTKLDPRDIDKPFTGLNNYEIKRQGNAYINLTPELLPKEKQEFGYRDPDEIQRVIGKYKPMIEYCFRKGIDNNSGLQGFVKVQFNISHTGQVIPESIRILNSTINDRQVEQCIKNYIKRWRNFKVLDESMGIARVTQKFIFD